MFQSDPNIESDSIVLYTMFCFKQRPVVFTIKKIQVTISFNVPEKREYAL